MRGQVSHINRGMCRIAVKTADEGYSIIDMTSDDPPELGDVLEWDDHRPLGGETIRNVTQRVSYEVFFQNHWVHPDALRAQLGAE